MRLGSGNKNRESTYTFFSAQCSEKLAWTPGVKGHIIKGTISGWTTANLATTVEPPNSGHVGTRHFVLYREVVLSSEVIKCTSIIGKWNIWELKVCPL